MGSRPDGIVHAIPGPGACRIGWAGVRLEEIVAILHRVSAHAQLDGAVREESVDAAWYGRFLGAVGRHPVFRRLWFGALASSVGQWMQQVALGWLAIVMTNSPGFVGIVTFSAGVPFLVVAPFGGALIDRIDRRRLMLSCQVLAFLLAAVLAVDVMSGFIQPWHLPIAAFLNGSLQALLIPTQQSLVPALVPRESLTNAVGLMSAGQNMTRVVGPSVAGVVIGTIGVGPTFLAQAMAIAASFLLVLGIVLPPRAQRTARGSSIFDGIRLVTSRPDLRSLFLLASIPTFFVFPYIGFLNVFARDILQIGAQGLGLLMAVSGCGAVVGSLLVAAAARSEGTGRLLLGMTVLYGLPIVGVALSRTLWITLPMLFVAGMLGAAFMSGNNALVQHRVSDDVRGRVMGAYMLTWGLMPLGSLPMGMIADRIGTPAAVAGGAVISSVLAGILGLTSSAVRDV
jgi:predicted MFS family arabinose efflux permease